MYSKDDKARLHAQWLAAKSGVIDQADLLYSSDSLDGRWFECPCGGQDHVAWIPWEFRGLSRSLGDVLTCYVTNRQWLIQRPDAADEIRDEEEAYIKLLENAPAVVLKAIRQRGWSEETMAFLWDTHGIDHETSQAIVDSLRALAGS